MAPEYITLGILAVVVLLLITEWTPMAVTGILIPVALVAFGIVDAEKAFLMFGNPLILLVTCAFIFGAAFFRAGLADVIGGWVTGMAVRYGGGGERFVIGLIMTITALMSTILPNLGVVAAMLPVFMAVAKSTGIAPGRILMPAAFASSLGGTITLIGSPNNLVGRGALETAGSATFGFFDFAWIGLPFTVIGILYMLSAGRKWLPSSENIVGSSDDDGVSGTVRSSHPGGGRGNGADRVSAQVLEVAESEPAARLPRRKQIITVVLFFVFVLGIALEEQTGVAAYLVGFVCVALLVLCGVMNEKEIYRNIDWSTIFFIVGILTLAGAIVSSGASQLVADSFISVLGEAANPYVLTGGMFLVAAVLTQFMSNTATAGILAPVAVSMGVGMGADPRALVMAVVIGCASAFMTSMGTPANMMVTLPGNVRFLDWVRCGWPLVVIGLVLSVSVLPVVWPFYN